MRNPYIVGPFVFFPNFYGRQDLIDELLDERHQCIYLIGNRRAGKTSLLRHLESLDHQMPCAVVYLNLQAIGGSSAKMGKYLVSQVQRKATQSPYLKQVSFGPSRDVCNVVTELAETAESKQFSMLLLWDESEELLALKPDCLKRLRAALQHTVALRTILSTTKRLSLINDLCRSWTTSPFLSGFKTRYISPLTEHEAIELICQTNNLEGQVQVKPDLLEQIMTYTGNHPYLIQLLCDRLFQKNGYLRSITDDDLIVDDQLTDFFQIDYDALSSSEQALLHILSGKSGAKQSDLEQKIALTADQLRSYLHGLGQLGFVRRMPSGEHEIANLFLLTWLRMGCVKKTQKMISDQASLEIAQAGDTDFGNDAAKKDLSTPLRGCRKSRSKTTNKADFVFQDQANSPLFHNIASGGNEAIFQVRDVCNIILVTVTKTEAQAVFNAFSKAASDLGVRLYIGDKIYYALGTLAGADVYMVQSEMGTSTPGGALITIHKAIETLHPVAVIMVGIAFGARPDKQQMGDILVSKQLMAYEPGKVKDRNQFIPRGDRVTCSVALLDKFRTADLDWPGPTAHFGLILTGEKLISDEAFRSQLLKLEPEAIGGEMEGAGLYAAAQSARVDWILVKAICDWADIRKADNAQPQAAKNAAEFVLHTLKIGGWTPSNNRQQAAASGTSSYQATVNGSGAVSQGNNNVTVGAGAVYVAGNVGGDVVTGEKITPFQVQSSSAISQTTQRALEMARRSLTILEERAAGYTSLTIPAHLQLELEDKRKEVEELERRSGR